MTRWLQAAKQLNEQDVQRTLEAQTGAANGLSRVLSVFSVLSGGEGFAPSPYSLVEHAAENSERSAARADGLDPDTGGYLDHLRLHGPATYGAMSVTLRWGATRASRAEAKLRAMGLVRYRDGKAEPLERGAT